MDRQQLLSQFALTLIKWPSLYTQVKVSLQFKMSLEPYLERLLWKEGKLQDVLSSIIICLVISNTTTPWSNNRVMNTLITS